MHDNHVRTQYIKIYYDRWFKVTYAILVDVVILVDGKDQAVAQGGVGMLAHQEYSVARLDRHRPHILSHSLCSVGA